jgi:predicted transposase YbfD/YdcC
MATAQQRAERAFEQVVDWLEHFEALDDPRQQGKVWYPLDEVLLLCLLAVLAGAESWVEIAEFGKHKIAFLRRFRPFTEGTPSHDSLGELFAALDAEKFQACFVDWTASLTKHTGDIVAIDGKTLRRTYQEGGKKGAIHMVSAWSARQRLVLGQTRTAEKSNEITAIPDLLDLITVKGAVVTIDAMGCQKEIAAKIIDNGADYVLALKGNQGSLRDDVELFFGEQKERRFADAEMKRHQTLGKEHGRIETRTVSAIDATGWLAERHGFRGLKSVIMVESVREMAGEPPAEAACETRYYISSFGPDAERAAEAIRAHWGIENSHHWVMDMLFREDECRIRKDNGPANFATITRIAANLLRQAPGKQSLRVRRRTAAWNDDYLAALVKA